MSVSIEDQSELALLSINIPQNWDLFLLPWDSVWDSVRSVHAILSCRIFESRHSYTMPGPNLGDIFPDFEVDTTKGRIKYHEYLGDK